MHDLLITYNTLFSTAHCIHFSLRPFSYSSWKWNVLIFKSVNIPPSVNEQLFAFFLDEASNEDLETGGADIFLNDGAIFPWERFSDNDNWCTVADIFLGNETTGAGFLGGKIILFFRILVVVCDEVVTPRSFLGSIRIRLTGALLQRALAVSYTHLTLPTIYSV